MNLLSDQPPPKPVRGDLWFDLSNNLLYFYNGSCWDHVPDISPITVMTKEQFEQWALEVLHGKR